MDIVKENITDAKKYLTAIREQHYELEELKYERYLEENGLCIKVSNPARICISSGGSNDLSNIPVHIEQFMENYTGCGTPEKNLLISFQMPEAGPF